MNVTRYAKVTNSTEATVARYLPGNYHVVDVNDADPNAVTVYIEGEDNAGWTLDDYVIPRLASGLIVARETDRDGNSL